MGPRARKALQKVHGMVHIALYLGPYSPGNPIILKLVICGEKRSCARFIANLKFILIMQIPS